MSENLECCICLSDAGVLINGTCKECFDMGLRKPAPDITGNATLVVCKACHNFKHDPYFPCCRYCRDNQFDPDEPVPYVRMPRKERDAYYRGWRHAINIALWVGPHKMPTHPGNAIMEAYIDATLCCLTIVDGTFPNSL